ncbi:DUF4352 domain-containing protein [Staphylococcus sp. GDY8P131P]|uniref:DUF4352 domain-containing protein n=1 Tax=Staphylococcus sp. GDY8P131P TaxID=2804159 RepID=UPI001AEC5A02|nr:DUF4352 domain-containing protein [Staphylococcus sp. GDY8P131P]
MLWFLWFLISIAFIVMLVITIVKASRKRKVKGSLITTIILFVVGLICFIGGVASTPTESESEDYKVEKGSSDNSNDSSKKDEDSKKKTLDLGDKLTVGGVDVTVSNAEFVEPDNEYADVENGKILKVSYKFKNNSDEQVLVDDTDFNLTINNETQDNFYGMDDSNDGFSHQLNKGNTGSGYVYYDVPDADEYKAEMDFMPEFETYKADWIIKNSDIQ